MNPFNTTPVPLMFSDHNIVLSFSPKSACSHVVLWFYRHEGLMEAAGYYSAWPHNFRNEVYYKAATYKRRRRAAVEAQGKGYTLIRVTRDPTKRFVSCFRHAVRWPLVDPLVKRKVGTTPARDGMSLNDYAQALQGEDLQTPSPVDVHSRVQNHPLWQVGFDRIITLNVDETHVNAGLNAIEAELGLSKTDFASHPQFAALREVHYATDTPYEGDTPLEQLRIPREGSVQFPKKQLETLPQTKAIAQKLHGVDFGRVSSGDSAKVLFQQGCALAR
ncbi:hypothetical protein OS189_16840 [Sulfitobacter sp. F26169L]|uniref:hypothetical protein n=1 Tax=Sulfitobacter sp. F26169L TaxID=2996015 RepID=UPI002260AD71|nr:hypothetical protein [Sulfitobacter sp. F26169L]MCX7568011.1 hypothetical protein [Sulfitobacter sp. F26169L]